MRNTNLKSFDDYATIFVASLEHPKKNVDSASSQQQNSSIFKKSSKRNSSEQSSSFSSFIPKAFRKANLYRDNHWPVFQPESNATIESLTNRILNYWNQRENAGPFVNLWVKNSQKKWPSTVGGENNMEKEAIGAAVAAVAVVIAIVLWLRHNKKVEVSGVCIKATPDFEYLSNLAARVDEVGEYARTIVQKVREPWNFTILEGLQDIVDVNQKRRLLFALCQVDSTVNILQPKAGEFYQPLEMSSSSECSGTCRWVVSADVALNSAGFKQRDTVLLPANVEVCTVDWWLLVSKDPGCLIGNEIRANAEDYTGQNEEYISNWQAVDGFDVFVDLREVFDEESIYKWSKRYAKEIAEAYPSNPERHLFQLGAVDEEYDLSVMRTDGEAPVGTARVVKVVERDGYAQYGLGCPQQPPLLYSIVEVEEI